MSRRKPSQLPSLTVYSVPARHLGGNLAEMLVWDAVYFLLTICGQTNRQQERFVDVRLQDIAALTDITTKRIRSVLDDGLTLPEPFRLWEEEGDGAYTLRLKFKRLEEQFRQGKAVQKPVSFMQAEGGAQTVTDSAKSYERWEAQRNWGIIFSRPYPDAAKASRFPLAILNLFLGRPNGRFISLDELVRRCGKKKSKSNPERFHLRTAADHLLALGLLVEPEPERFQLVREQLHTSGEAAWQQLLNQRSKAAAKQRVWITKQNQTLLKLAKELAQLGKFDPITHLREIYDYLYSLQLETDLPLLKTVATSHRRRPPGRNRWHDCCDAFEKKLRRQQTIVRTPKVKLDLKRQAEQRAPLRLQTQAKAVIRFGRLVLWINDRRFRAVGMERAAQISVVLKQQAQTIWQRIVTYEDALVHADLTASMKQADPVYEIEIKSGRPLRQFTITAQLEAEFLKG